MSKIKKLDNDGQIPKSIINQMIEHTSGGFVLFYFNSETGTPEEVMTFDSPAHCLAFQKHISDWTDALKDLNVEAERNHIIDSCEPPYNEDDKN